MPPARVRATPSRRLLRSVAVLPLLACTAVAGAVLNGAVAAADEPAGTTVVGQLLQAWPDHEHVGTAAGHHDDGPLSWVETAAGDAVRVPTGEVAGIPAGATVSVTVGAEVADGAADEDGYDPAREVLAADVLAPAPATPALSRIAGITNRVTVVLVTPGGVARDGVTEQQVVDAVDGPVAAFWSEQSRGAVEVGVSASHGWRDTAADCSDPAALWSEVATGVGFDPGPGRHLMLYVSSAATDCSYALAEVGSGPASGGRLYVRAVGASIIAHELGHNFGLGHSSGRQCDGTVETGACRTAAYGDLYDVMGVSWAQLGSLNAAQAARLGVLPAAEQQVLAVQGGPATVTLAPLSGAAGIRALRLTDADGVDYWLEYRTATGRDAWLAGPGNVHGLQTGVLLRRAEGLPDTSVLLDGTPAGAGRWDADLQTALPVGVAVPVSGGDFSVVVQTVSAAGAVLTVTPSAAPAAGVPAPPAGVAPGGVLPGVGEPADPTGGGAARQIVAALPAGSDGGLRAPTMAVLDPATGSDPRGVLGPVAGALPAAALPATALPDTALPAAALLAAALLATALLPGVRMVRRARARPR